MRRHIDRHAHSMHYCTGERRRNGAATCRELPVSVECPVSTHQSALNIKRAVFRTKSANRSVDSRETDISGRVIELCPHKSTCRFDLAARDVTPARTAPRTARHYDNHIDISYSCQSSASAIIRPTNYRPGLVSSWCLLAEICVFYIFCVV